MVTDEQFEKLCKIFSDGFGHLNHTVQVMAEATVQIEHNLAQMVVAANPSPNYYKSLSDYASFDWSTIGAKVVDDDDDGPTHVEWNDRIFQRRSGNPTFGAVIYYSRAVGKDAAGVNKYERLITFKTTGEAVEVPKKTMKLAESDQTTKDSRRQQSQQPASQPPTQRPEPPKGDGVACSLPQWDALTKTVDAAGKFGVMPENWKPRVKSVVGSDDMRSLGDADIAKAISVIKGLVETRQLASRSANVA